MLKTLHWNSTYIRFALYGRASLGIQAAGLVQCNVHSYSDSTDLSQCNGNCNSTTLNPVKWIYSFHAQAVFHTRSLVPPLYFTFLNRCSSVVHECYFFACHLPLNMVSASENVLFCISNAILCTECCPQQLHNKFLVNKWIRKMLNAKQA